MRSPHLKTLTRYGIPSTVVLAILLVVGVVFKPIPFHFGAKQVFMLGNKSEAQHQIARFSTEKHPFLIEQSTHALPDGGNVAMLYLRHENPKGLVVYFQGGGSSSWGVIDNMASTFRELPIDILIYDYRGTGLTGGQADPSKLVDDAAYLIGVAKNRLPANLPIVYYGVSMGTLFSGELARRVKPDGLVFDGAITTVEQLVRGQIPCFVRHFISIHIDSGLADFNNLVEGGWNGIPALLLLGQNDVVTPLEFSRAIYEKSTSKDCIAIKTIAGASHAQAFSNDNGRKELVRFVKGIIEGHKCAVLGKEVLVGEHP